MFTLQRAQGKTRKEFVAELSAAGLALSERQLDRWVARVNTTGSAISVFKATGRSTLLNRDARDIMSGWVLNQNSLGVPVHLRSYCGFARDQFDVILTERTASNYLSEDGFAYREIHKKAKSFVVNVDELRLQLWR